MTVDQAVSPTAAQLPTPEPVIVAGVRVINCNACHENKAETEYAFKNKATGKRNTKCKPCMREYNAANYKANKSTFIAASNRRNVAVRDQTRKMVAALLVGVTCSACNEAPTEKNDLVVIPPGAGDTAGMRVSAMIERGWAPARVAAAVTEAVEADSVLCRVCLGKRCGAQNRQSLAARARAEAAAEQH